MSFPLGIKRISLEKDNITIKKKILEVQDIEYTEITQRSAKYDARLEITKKTLLSFRS